MAKAPQAEEKLPPFPIGCFDRDALEAALRGGATGQEALEAATVCFDHLHDNMPEAARPKKEVPEPEKPAVIETPKLAKPAATEKE